MKNLYSLVITIFSFLIITNAAFAQSESEPNGEFGSADNLTPGTTMSGTIFPEDDLDYFTWTAPFSGVFVLKVQEVPSSVDLRITAYDEGGSRIWFESNGFGLPFDVELLAEAGEIYYFLVQDNGNNNFSSNSYKINVIFDTSDECEMNQSIATACLVDVNSTQIGKIYGFTFNTVDDVDYYKIIAPKSGVVVANLTNVPANLDMSITTYDVNGARMFNEYNGKGLPFAVELLVEGGETYYFEVEDRSNNDFSPESYTLTFSFDESDKCEMNESIATACLVDVNSIHKGKIYGFTYNTVDDVDYYKIIAPKSGVVVANLTNVPANLDMRITTYDINGARIFEEYNGKGLPFAVELLVEAGATYYFKLDDRSNNDFSPDSYTLTFSFDDSDECEMNESIATACPISVGATFKSKIYGFTYGWMDDVDYFEVRPNVTENLTVRVFDTPQELDIQISVYGESGNRLTIAFQNGGLPVDLSFLGEAGTPYYILVEDRGRNDFSSEPYTFSLNGLSTPTSEILLEKRLKVFPNPAQDVLNFNFENSKQQTAEISLLNAAGQQFFTKKIDGKLINEAIDLSGIPAGFYFFKIQIADEFLMKKVLVQKF